MALMSKVTGQDVAWTVQPSMALMAAMLCLLLAELLRPLIEPAPVRAGVAFLGAQSAMLLGYTLWGGVKEVAGGAAAGARAAARLVRDRPDRRPLALDPAGALGCGLPGGARTTEARSGWC